MKSRGERALQSAALKRKSINIEETEPIEPTITQETNANNNNVMKVKQTRRIKQKIIEPESIKIINIEQFIDNNNIEDTIELQVSQITNLFHQIEISLSITKINSINWDNLELKIQQISNKSIILNDLILILSIYNNCYNIIWQSNNENNDYILTIEIPKVLLNDNTHINHNQSSIIKLRKNIFQTNLENLIIKYNNNNLLNNNIYNLINLTNNQFIIPKKPLLTQLNQINIIQLNNITKIAKNNKINKLLKSKNELNLIINNNNSINQMTQINDIQTNESYESHETVETHESHETVETHESHETVETYKTDLTKLRLLAKLRENNNIINNNNIILNNNIYNLNKRYNTLISLINILKLLCNKHINYIINYNNFLINESINLKITLNELKLRIELLIILIPEFININKNDNIINQNILIINNNCDFKIIQLKLIEKINELKQKNKIQ